MRGKAEVSGMAMHTLVCLLPVRNGEHDLPGCFCSVSRFADAVVALDDGSTDRTREILAAEPLVKVLLTNPVRPDYQGWDDAANRNRLLAAAACLEPTWLLSLDADERITADDGAALRDFVEHDAIPGCAFGFRVYRMWEDSEHYSRAGLWVYRLFAYEPGQRFPDRRLHFVPIPTAIPASRWVRTTVRIQHLGSLTDTRRRARFAKYRQADPSRSFQHSYRDLLAPGDVIKRWEPRPPSLPVLVAMGTNGDHALFDPDHPTLSAIIIARNDEARIARTVASVVQQESPWPFEVIVVTSGHDRTAEIVREQFPQVMLIALPRPALPGEARNAGLRVAKGDYVSFPGSHVELPPGSLAARIRAHDRGYAMVTGTTLNGTTTRAGWASYFLDHAGVLPGRPSTELQGAPAHCSYSRAALLEIGGFPEDRRAGEDTVVNNALRRQGYVAYRAQDIQLIHYSPCRTPWRLVRHHFVRGRGFGRILLEQPPIAQGRRPVRLGTLFVRQVLRRTQQTTRNVRMWGNGLAREYWLSFPLVLVGALAAWTGTCYEILRGRR